MAAAYSALLLFFFSAPWSLPLARVALVTSLLCLIFGHRMRGKHRLILPLSWWLALVCVAFTSYCTWHGIKPSLGLPKCRKLLWFLAFLAPATLLHNPRRVWQSLTMLSLGTLVLSLEMIAKHFVKAYQTRAQFKGSLLQALINQGSMTDGQRIMIGLIATLGILFLIRRSPGACTVRLPTGLIRRRKAAVMQMGCWRWVAVLVVQGSAFIINFKRGSWFCGAFVMGTLVLSRLGRRAFLFFCLILTLVLALPQTQTRMATLKDEFNVKKGGRLTMWVKIAPALLKDHVWTGVGYRSVTPGRFHKIVHYIEPARDHLHSNILDILVDTGVIGLTLHALWFGSVIVGLCKWKRDAGIDSKSRLAASIVAGMFASLLLNGLIEFNYGDSEIVLCYVALMGAAAAGARFAPQTTAGV